MKLASLQRVVFAAVVAALVIEARDAGRSCAEESPGPFDKRLAAIENVWKKEGWVKYYEAADKLATDILAAGEKSDQNRVAASFLEITLAKELDVGAIPQDDLYVHHKDDVEVMDKLASYLDSNEKATTEESRTNVLLVCRYLGRLRKELVPNYKDKPVFAKVMPPKEFGGYSDNTMDEEEIMDAIADPAIRAKYRAAIRENAENQFLNARQQKLKGKAAVTAANLLNVMFDVFADWEDSSAILAKCAKEARLTDKETKELKSRLASAKAALRAVRERDEAADGASKNPTDAQGENSDRLDRASQHRD
jgi:hypothetical protein